MECEQTILFLPLDERPCNYLFPKLLAEGSGIRLILPERDRLGKKKIPADWEYVREFLLENAARATRAVVSLDMLLYGGLLPSRLHRTDEAELSARLETLREMKKRNPELIIYGFQLVMRCPKYSSNDEEPDYYGTCGREIFLLGEALDKRRAGLFADEAEIEAYRSRTEGVIDDYLSRRAVNVQMNKRAIDLAGDVIDFLIIPQDDSAEYGFTAADQREVRDYAQTTKKQLCIAVYPGADEVGMTLICRAVLESKGLRPKIYPLYAADSAPFFVPNYEDRMLGESVKAQISACGGTVARALESADIVLAVNAPAGKMLEADRWREGGAQYRVNRSLTLFVQEIADGVRAGKAVAVADVAYSNGGDPELCALLGSAGLAFEICAYAGWNTAGNTLGTAIAQAALSLACGARNEKFLALRYFEDLGYCTHTRRFVTDRLAEYGCGYFDLKDRGGEVSEFVRAETERLMADAMPSVAGRYRIAACTMPWNRMFETEFTVDERK